MSDVATHLDVHLTEAQLGELADGTLAGGERDVAERHVAACAECRQGVAEARSVLAMARRASDGVAAPPELWPLVAASTVHAARLRRRTLRSMRGVLALAAAALVIGTAVVTAVVTAAVATWLRPTPAEDASQAVRDAQRDAQRAAQRAAERGDAARRSASDAAERAPHAPRAPEAPRPPQP